MKRLYQAYSRALAKRQALTPKTRGARTRRLNREIRSYPSSNGIPRQATQRKSISESPEIPPVSSSSSESLSSPAPTLTPTAPTRKTRRAEEKLRAETIAERKLAKLTAAKAKIAEDLATRNSERAANRKRLADAQQAADDEAADVAEVFDIVNEASEEREKSRLPPGPSKSKTKLIDIEESLEANQKRRKGNDKDDKRPSTENSVDEKESIA